MSQHILDELNRRGLIEQFTNEDGLRKWLETPNQSIYIGFDPTATSLHIGSLLPIMVLSRMQKAGHKPIILVGGATGFIGDPSGKDSERAFQTPEMIQKNVDAIQAQLSHFVSFEGENAAILVNNLDWISPISYLQWLREVGKYFSVNYMVAKESVRRRIEERDQGISYTEFSYMLLQAFDFLAIFQKYGCRVQAGGNDQWGNITAGTDLIRKKLSEPVYGLTFPLLMTSSGEKFGKSAGNAVWLDSKLTSPYAFYQYWIGTDDREVKRFLLLFTFLSVDEINSLVQKHEEHPEKRLAQRELAARLTKIVHGERGLQIAKTATEILFGKKIENLDDDLLSQIFADVPSTTFELSVLSAGKPLIDFLVETGAQKSKGSARRLLKQGGVYLNNQRIRDAKYVITPQDLASETMIVLRTGKKKFFLVQFSSL